MKCHCIVIASLAATMIAAGPGRANAATVDFEDVTVPDIPALGTAITSDGFTFTPSSTGFGVFLKNVNLAGNPTGFAINLDGTNTLVVDGNGTSSTPASVTMAESNSSLFSVSQLFGATGLTNEGDGKLLVIGQLGAGGTVTETLSLTPTFQTLSLNSSFTGLSKLILASGETGATGSEPGFALDDIVVNSNSGSITGPVAGTPEPGTIILMALGLGVAGIWRRYMPQSR